MLVICVNSSLYRPDLLPVDYGGTVVCRLSISLENGEYLEHSTLESQGEGLERALELALCALEKSCQRRYEQEGLLPLKRYLEGIC